MFIYISFNSGSSSSIIIVLLWITAVVLDLAVFRVLGCLASASVKFSLTIYGDLHIKEQLFNELNEYLEERYRVDEEVGKRQAEEAAVALHLRSEQKAASDQEISEAQGAVALRQS